MKLPDFRESKALNRLRKSLNAPLLRGWESTIDWDRVEWTPLDPLSVEGISVELDDVTVAEDGSFEYTDRKVLVYIRDQGSKSSGRSDYRFHVAWCSTLKKKHGQKEYKNRYVVTTRKDGRFPVGGSSDNGNEEERLVEMQVCRNCLSKLNYKNYRETRDQTIPEQFDIETFFRQYEDPADRGPLQQFKTFLLPSED